MITAADLLYLQMLLTLAAASAAEAAACTNTAERHTTNRRPAQNDAFRVGPLFYTYDAALYSVPTPLLYEIVPISIIISGINTQP